MIHPSLLGISAAASWAWGTSLIVGMQIAQEKGLVTWLIWAIANTLTLSFFGELAKCGIIGRCIFDKPYIKWLAIIIQVFCLIIQLNIINKVLLDMGVTPTVAYSMSSGIGILFTILMYKKGLATSILTDVYQWGICMIAIVSIIAVGMLTNAELTIYPTSSTDDILWGCWSACILMSGLIGDVQHWQRAEVAGKSNAYHWGALFFGVYMVLILVMSTFKFNLYMNIILLLAVLCVTTSTIDSIAVALHELGNKKIGTSIALFICLCWGVFAQIGIVDLWSKAGVYRVLFALIILFLGVKQFLCKTERKRKFVL